MTKNKYLDRILLEGPPPKDLPKYSKHPLDRPEWVRGGAYETVNTRLKEYDRHDELTKKYKSSQPISNAKNVTSYSKIRRYVSQHPYKVGGGVAAVGVLGYGAKKLYDHGKE